MTAPCCPQHAGGRGEAGSAHWFVMHDGDGAIDLALTAEISGLPRSDIDLARSVAMMAEEAGWPLLYAAQTKRWLLWDGSGVYAAQQAEFEPRMTAWAADAVWEACRDVAWVQQQEIERLPAEQRRTAADAARVRWSKQLALRDRMRSDAGQEALTRRMQRACAVDDERLDSGTGEIVVDNGRISYEQVLRDGFVKLLPHDRRKLETRRTGSGVRYDPDARAPWFRHFLETSVADSAQRDLLLWRTVNALFGRMPRKGFVNTIGERDSGKSTFTDLVARLAGQSARTVPAETFLAKHASDSGFKQAELRGARFVYTHEPRPGSRFDESLMKTLTGSDKQRTAGKWEKPVEWVPQLTIFIGSNAPIRFASSDDAFITRQEVVEFARGYAAADNRIGDRMRAELPGVLNELLSYAVREAAWGVPPVPQSSVEARERMAEETEDALGFLAEWLSEGRLVEKPDAAALASVQVSRMYAWYRTWCDEAGERAVGRKTFSAIVGRRYKRVRSGGVWHFQGLVGR